MTNSRLLWCGLTVIFITTSIASAANSDHPAAVETVTRTPGLVAFWTFGEEPGKSRSSTGTREALPLQEVGGPIARVEGGPFSGYSAELNGKQYFKIPYAETGGLNICGAKAQVSMFAVVHLRNLQQSRTIAGMWSEGKGANDDTGTRQYALLMTMPTYGGPRQLTPHISSEGGVTRRADGSAFPWCADYAASKSEVPEQQWCTLGFTYDGGYLRAYINGVMEERTLDPVKDKRADPYFTTEGQGGKDRGMNPYYHGRGIFCYDPVRHAHSKPGGGSDFTVGARYAVGSMLREAIIGRFGGLAVFNRSLTDAEMNKLHEAANVSALPELPKTKPPRSRPVIDTSPNRTKTPLDPGLKQIGVIQPRSANEITGSNWTLGCETLDRDFADYDEYKEYLVPLGIKTIRLQAGWAKTEKAKGVYDFRWLDKIIDDARARGLNILLETGYGNPIYTGGGGWDLAGGFPTSEEALAAWDRWVATMARRYRAKVRDWAMWNEPDINKQHQPEDIAVFNIRTAEIIKREIPDARMAGLSLASSSPKLLESCLSALAKRGKVDLFHWFIYHGYAMNPDSSYANVEALKATLAKYSAIAKMRQGENGCPSERATKFALSNHPWTEFSQAKWDLRRMLGDLGHDVESAVFTICDFNHTGREINRKGLLYATADKKVQKIKLAWYSVQNVVAVFDDTLERIPAPDIKVAYDQSTASFAYRNRQNGQHLIALWDNSGIPHDAFETRPAQLAIKGFDLKEPVWVDMVSGRIYEIPAENITRDGNGVRFKDIPLYDAPVLVAEKSLVLK